MPVSRRIVETRTLNFGCDLCGTVSLTMFVYESHGVIDRKHENAQSAVSAWTESEWELCVICAGLLDNRNRMGLLHRMDAGNRTRSGYAPEVSRGLLDELLKTVRPDSKRVLGGIAGGSHRAS